MGDCEICGKIFDNLEKAIVEGVMIDVCHNCGNFGKVVPVRKPLVGPKRVIPVYTKDFIEDIVTDYSEIIKKAREKKGLKQEELAKEIAEKESVIQKVENGSLRPSFILAKKLEQFFSIKLIESLEEKREISLNLKDNGLTIGDLLKLKK